MIVSAFCCACRFVVTGATNEAVADGVLDHRAATGCIDDGLSTRWFAGRLAVYHHWLRGIREWM